MECDTVGYIFESGTMKARRRGYDQLSYNGSGGTYLEQNQDLGTLS
jgi:hypothetical protein